MRAAYPDALMSLRSLRLVIAPLAILMLAGFRMPVADEETERLLYDVRGAFVTAQPDVSRDLIARTDILVDAAIQATSRSMMLPRTILTVRISQTARAPILFGSRSTASVTVKVVSVGSGDPVAEGSFEVSALAFGKSNADTLLAEKIADRIAGEFRLEMPRRRAVATALVESARP